MATATMATATSGIPLVHCKLVLLGDAAVGKSCLITRFGKNEFYPYHEPTIGAAFMTQNIQLPDAIVRFEIWDTAGAERFRSLASLYYRGAAAGVIVYDITKKESFDGAKIWVNELLNFGSPDIILALAGNKSDLSANRAVSTAEAQEYAEANSLIFFETSAQTGSNVVEVFKQIAIRLPKNPPGPDDEKNDPNRITLAASRSGTDDDGKSLLWSCCGIL